MLVVREFSWYLGALLPSNYDLYNSEKINDPSKIGIFPSCYVHIKKRSKTRLLDESIMVAEEWSRVYFDKFSQIGAKKQIQAVRSLLESVSNFLSHMMDLRRQLVSGLTSDKFKQVEQQLADCIDFGNNYLALHLVVRNEKQRIYQSRDINVIDLYRNFNQKMTDLDAKVQKYNQRRTDGDPLGNVLGGKLEDKNQQKRKGLRLLILIS